MPHAVADQADIALDVAVVIQMPDGVGGKECLHNQQQCRQQPGVPAGSADRR